VIIAIKTQKSEIVLMIPDHRKDTADENKFYRSDTSLQQANLAALPVAFTKGYEHPQILHSSWKKYDANTLIPIDHGAKNDFTYSENLCDSIIQHS